MIISGFSMLSVPIPKALLPHTVTLRIPKSEGIFSDGDYDEIILYHVRVDLNEKFKQSKTGETRTHGAVMYYDCANSSRSDKEIKFEKLSSGCFINFYGDTYRIAAVKSVAAVNKVHHYRFELT